MQVIVSAIVGLICLAVVLPIVSSVVSDLPEDTPSAVTSILDTFPFIMIITVLVGCLSTIVKYIKFKRWRDFGNRMKEAYSAKFGGENTGFNEEVDQHIKMMEALGQGPSKSVAEDWLKRMATFVEIPYIIPEEEVLSEEEKTSQYRRIDEVTNKPL